MESVVCTLMKAQADLGQMPSVFCTDTEGAFYNDAPVSAKCSGNRKRALLVVDWHVARKLIQFARDQKIDVLHAHNPVGQLYAVLVSRRLGVPVLVTYHGQAFQETPRRRLFRRVLCWATAEVVAISEDVKTLLVEQRVAPARKVQVVKNGIMVGEFEQKITKGTKETVTIGSVGRLAPEKNYALLIRAFALLQKKLSTPHAQLILVGDGSERTSLEALAAELGLTEHVTFTGASQNVDRWLRDMDVFCLSSDSEGTSIALLEAAAHGLPAVVTDVGGNSEIVKDGVSGIVTPPNDLEDFAEALVKLSADADLRAKMGSQAREHVLQVYSANVMAEEYASLYSQSL